MATPHLIELERAATYSDCVGIVATYFDEEGVYFGHGTDNASDEAYWLVGHLIQWDDSAWVRAPDADRVAEMRRLAVERVATRTPLAYLLGEAWFAGLRFKVDRRVLVPRSPLAELIEQKFEPWCRLEPGDRVLDVGTGSGCIAVAIAFYCDGVIVDATDAAPDALELASENVREHGCADRVRLWQADLFPPREDRYRVIISNPPYVPADVLPSLPAEYAHEPVHGLDGGNDGLEPTHRLLAGASERLTDDGVLIVEVGEAADALSAAYPRLPVVWLSFDRGGEGVFLVTSDQLRAAGL